MREKASEESVRSDYEQARIQDETDEKLANEGLTSRLIEQQSRVKSEQLSIRLKLEAERTKIAADSASAKLAAQQAKAEQMKALDQSKKSHLEPLHLHAGIPSILHLLPLALRQQLP